VIRPEPSFDPAPHAWIFDRACHDGSCYERREVVDCQSAAIATGPQATLEFALSFPDYREAVEAGAIHHASNVHELAEATHLPERALAGTLGEVEACRAGRQRDAFDRDFSDLPPLQAPYRAVKVTGALFHTQGGLVIDGKVRVMGPDGSSFPNLFAGGGAAGGVSGPDVSGYLSGNGLLTAIAFGYLAGDFRHGL
jgi:fumarate reductase flavoprotein subunit